jgi:antitoxin (DNA-binding transcriptional repressor) of toxin-antitoxin stability system
MTVSETVERRVDLGVVGHDLSQVIERAVRAGERLVIEKDGTRLAVVVPDEAMVARAARMTELFDLMDRLSDAFADVPLEELEREVDRAVREVRAERRDAHQDR